MKKILFASSLLLAGVFSACSDYNDQFNIDPELTDIKNIALTLESTDYGSIAGMEANKALALAKDPDNNTYLNALNAVGANKYFTEEAPGEDYLPAYLNAKYPNADIGSKFVVTFNQYQAPAAYLADFGKISDYTLTADNYKTVWGEKVNASYLSPATLNKIPVLLKENVAGAEKGDMKVVNYSYSNLEPSTGGTSGEEAVVFTKLSEVLANTAGGEYTVKGEVVATYARGLLLSDGTGAILVYFNAFPNYSIGDVVSVAGTTSKYSGLMQFPNTSVVTLLERKTSFAYPTAQHLSGTELDALATTPSAKYISFDGTLSISGDYYNITVADATRKGSASYPVGGVINADLNGKEVTVTGYFIGSSATFANVMATSVVEKGTTAANKPVGVVALSPAGTYTVVGTVAETYARGFLLTDGTGSILVYKSDTGAKKGDIVTVSGTTSAYSGFMQYPATAEVVINGTGKVISKTPMLLDTEAIEAYPAAPFMAYVSYEGTLIISGNYYNVAIDGTTAVQGSISYPVTDLINADLNGKRVVVEGYAIGTSGSTTKFLNTMATSVKEATTDTRSMATRATTRASETGAAALYVYDGSGWSAYTNSDAKVTVVNPTVYSSLGTAGISNPEHVLPIYLANLYPYAADEDKAAVVYKKAADVFTVAEYTYSKGVWSETTSSVPTTVTFTKEASGISAQNSTYLNESFLGDEGGFTIQNVAMTGVTYVWSITSTYGWKATAFVNNTNNPSESWIVSPTIKFAKAVAPVMSFDEAHRYVIGDVNSFFSVQISEDYKGDVTTATWKTLEVPVWSDGTSWDFVNVGQIELSDYVGKTVYVAFKYVSTSEAAPTWEVKNLIIKEKTEEEAGE